MSNAQIVAMEDKEYFALPDLDQSQLKQYMRNPRMWAYQRLNPIVKTTPALNFGSAFHSLMLGGNPVVTMPEGMNLRTKAGKEWKAEQEEQDAIVVNAEEMSMLQTMKATMLSDPEAAAMLNEGLTEQVILWQDKPTGLNLKAKIDLIPVGDTPYIVDLKTTDDASAEKFGKHAIDYGYHIQAEFYRSAIALLNPKTLNRARRVPPSMVFWVIEKTMAPNFAKYQIHKETEIAKIARKQIRNALTKISNGMEARNVTTLDEYAQAILDEAQAPSVQDMLIPTWAVREQAKLI
ncbi:hypothetical protein GCM10007377_16180 [Galliscardovia ingluviei]|uniref:Putative exodeoxyribonuclease 8 PDDEXK-like domain-containing protein n=1 Tax=Galliscardovia ingluviei TaxID=1769422 RepID=A0A8J3AKS5_9BIFI|nr:PD-(D/E)XK nuclease-like domain-containing protein [Galliscardovia ingluviei]GGI15494.1 hypothetical protein GCM10007377_16180 [Galliscardovia ingluviei]